MDTNKQMSPMQRERERAHGKASTCSINQPTNQLNQTNRVRACVRACLRGVAEGELEVRGLERREVVDAQGVVAQVVVLPHQVVVLHLLWGVGGEGEREGG